MLDMKQFNNQVIATEGDTVYTVHVFADGSSAVMYSNKYHTNSIWCGISKLKNHIAHLSYLTKKNYLDNWTIVNAEFFKVLGIQ